MAHSCRSIAGVQSMLSVPQPAFGECGAHGAPSLRNGYPSSLSKKENVRFSSQFVARNFFISAARVTRSSCAALKHKHNASSIRCMAVAASGSGVEGAAAPAAKKGDDVWELDFCSRPILDDRGKKVWELLICDPSRSFTHAEYFPNSKINSTYLKEALEKVLATGTVNKPRQIRFFRSQMQTIISRACSELGVAIVPSRRCTALMGLLQERFETVYPLEAGFQKDAPPLMALQPGPLVELPDALRGEKWAFVQLPVSQLLEEMKEVSAQRIFGCTYDISNPALKLAPDTLIPGVAVFSSRATPLSAWTSSLEMAYIVADINEQALVLEAGISDRYRYGSWRRDDRKADREGIAWEAAKKAAAGVHFLAIQTDPDAPTVSGLWVLRQVDAPFL